VIIGVPREIKEGESRAAITPAGVHTLAAHGHRVVVQEGTGVQSGVDDAEYAAAGAELVEALAAVYARTDLVLKVKEPLRPEWPLLRRGQILFTYLHLASSEALTDALVRAGVTAIGYETIRDAGGGLPLLTPMSEIAGKLAVQEAAWCLKGHNGGRGILVGGVPGVPPAEVVILGAGSVGTSAVRVAMGLGAHVTILDVNHDRLRYLDDIMHGNCITVYSDPVTVRRAVAYADVLIGGVLIPGALAPKLVTADMVAQMKPGSVIVDVAIDQGGCVETSQITTHDQPFIAKHGVLHYGVPNMPAAVPRTSTFALTNATTRYVVAIADLGLDEAARQDPGIAAGVNVREGEIVHPAVRAAFGK